MLTSKPRPLWARRRPSRLRVPATLRAPAAAVRVGRGHLARRNFSQPCLVFVDIGGIYHHVKPVGKAVHEYVVEDTAVGATHEAVGGKALCETLYIVGQTIVEERHRVRTRDFDLPHVRNVENAGLLAHRTMLGYCAGFVLQRHFPPGERTHSGAIFTMPGMKRRLFEVLRHVWSPSHAPEQ